MLLTITCTGGNAAGLGWLLHKNPARPQTARFNFGRAHVFYPEVSPERCTAALLLDIDPLDLVRGRPGSSGRRPQNGLFDYVNDRPYVSSSFMSTAISRLYGTALSGRCEKQPELAAAALELSAVLAMLPCRGDTAMLERVFAPLGYTVTWSPGGGGLGADGALLDDRFPEWGPGPYVNLRLEGNVRLRDLLRHIYVLIPVFDFRKHYWMGEAEVDKLLTHGEGWLENHPERTFITRRYFNRIGSLSRMALERLDRIDNGEGGPDASGDADGGAGADENAASSSPVAALRLNTLRLFAVLSELQACRARSVLDLGCGEGNLLRLLAKEQDFTAIAGVDVSLSALSRAADNLKLPGKGQGLRTNGRITLFQGSLCYRDKRFKDYDAAAIVEVIEHLDENRLSALAAVVFGGAAPKTVIITTPNAEYNANYGIAEGCFRHGDHRFEWNRARFRAWAEAAAARYGYAPRFEDVGPWDEERGAPTQMGVFTK